MSESWGDDGAALEDSFAEAAPGCQERGRGGQGGDGGWRTIDGHSRGF